MGANDAECNGAEPPSEAPQSSQALCVATSLSPESASSDPALLLDALPYVDPLGDAQQEEVSLLLQREMAAIAAENGGAPPDYLKDALPLPQTPQLDSEDSLLGKEFRRKQRGEPLDALNFAHVHSFPNPSGGGKSATEVKEWEEALAVSRQLCGHASTAHVNLSLMTSHAPASWQHALKVLGGAAEREKQRVRKLTEEADSVCKNRKLEQLEAAATLKQLQENSVQYAQKNLQIMEAISPLALEVSTLRAKCLVRGILPEEYLEETEFDMEAWHRAVGEEPPVTEAAGEGSPENEEPSEPAETAMEEDEAQQS